MERPELDLQAYVADGLLRIALTGSLVDGTTARLRTWMERHVPATASRLVLDLAGLDAVDAVGLGALLAAHRRLAEGAQVQVDHVSEPVARALRQAGLDRVLRPVLPQQVSRTAPTTAEVTTATSAALLT
ncbi:MAG: anti-sigma factor antagonist [Frankiales bacterium]|nr:anti-sigma factor antagonist [Frankiales bacterium]